MHPLLSPHQPQPANKTYLTCPSRTHTCMHRRHTKNKAILAQRHTHRCKGPLTLILTPDLAQHPNDPKFAPYSPMPYHHPPNQHLGAQEEKVVSETQRNCEGDRQILGTGPESDCEECRHTPKGCARNLEVDQAFAGSRSLIFICYCFDALLFPPVPCCSGHTPQSFLW